jgi:HK97 family phage major capsid protein
MTTTEKKQLGTELERLYRNFAIVDFVPIKRRTAEERAAAIEARKKAKAAGDTTVDDDEDPDDETDGEAAGERDADRFKISISSEYPVQRWFGKEILDHSADSVDLSRAKQGLSFLDSHDSKAIIGIVERVKVKDKKLTGVARFSRGAKAQEVKRDVQDGIRKFISVGYDVNEYTLDKSSKDEGDTYRATRWAPMEASSVGVPADPTVGHDRSAGDHTHPVKILGTRSENSPASKPNEGEGTVEPSVTTAVTESRTAAAEIIRLGKLHQIDHDRVAKMVGDGLTVEQASREILADVAKRGAQPTPQPSAEEQDRINLTDREQQEYNIARGIMAAVQNVELDGQKRVTSFETEISDQIQKDYRGAAHGGLFVPWSIRHAWTPDLEKKFAGHLKKREERMQRAGLSSNVATAGQELKFTEPGEFIQFLYNRMRTKQLGARTLAGLRDNVSYPKQTGRATGAWVGENPGTDVADSALTLGSILSSPKTYQSSSSYSRQLLAQAVIDLDSLVREDLATDLALATDSAVINGTGTLQPLGIVNTTGVQSYTMLSDVANGGEPAWQDIVQMEEALEAVNADQLGEPAFLSTPQTKSILKRTARLGNTIGLPIWADDGTVDGLKALSSNQVPSTGTKGTGTGLSTFILGVWNQIIIGMWGSGFELVVDPYRLKKQGMIELTTFMMLDVTLKYPAGFVISTDVAK